MVSMKNGERMCGMQAIKAVFDGVSFMPKQPIPVKGQYEVVITFIGSIPTVDKVVNELCAEEIQSRMDWLNRIKKSIEISRDEDLSDFPSQGSMKTSPKLQYRIKPYFQEIGSIY